MKHHIIQKKQTLIMPGMNSRTSDSSQGLDSFCRETQKTTGESLLDSGNITRSYSSRAVLQEGANATQLPNLAFPHRLNRGLWPQPPPLRMPSYPSETG